VKAADLATTHFFTANADGQIEQAVEICLSAYDKGTSATDVKLNATDSYCLADENSVRALVGGDVSLLKEFFLATIRGAAGGRGAELHLATVGQEAIGMALWWGPGREPFSASVRATNEKIVRSRWDSLVFNNVKRCKNVSPNCHPRHRSGTKQR
jgi:hypothetical protein